MRACVVCGVEFKPLRAQKICGNACREERRKRRTLYLAEYYRANREKKRAHNAKHGAAYREKNREKRRHADKRWREANRMVLKIQRGLLCSIGEARALVDSLAGKGIARNEGINSS